jgi:pilus assembly protein CpaB
LPLRRRPILYWLVAVALAVASGGTVANLTARAEASLQRYGTLRPVAVATHDLDPGEVIGRGDVELRALPRGLIPSGALVSSPAGQVVRHPIYAGEVIVGGRLAPMGLSGTAALLPPGRRGVAVPIDPASGLQLVVGDEVDVLVTLDPTIADGDPTVTVARAALVVAVGELSATVAVTQDQAPRLAFAITQGVVTLALVGG